ncbi:MAG: four helix bundle protein [Terriglobales bacterium]
MQNFRNLDVWGKAHKLTIDVYRATAMFPKSELYGLTSQMRRASASIGANIAEGCGRRGNTELGRFLHIAMGSASELEYHLLLARDLQMLSDPEHRRLDVLVTELKRMLSRLIKSMPPEQHTN